MTYEELADRLEELIDAVDAQAGIAGGGTKVVDTGSIRAALESLLADLSYSKK